jgi:hypothetical protein
MNFFRRNSLVAREIFSIGERCSTKYAFRFLSVETKDVSGAILSVLKRKTKSLNTVDAVDKIQKVCVSECGMILEANVSNDFVLLPFALHEKQKSQQEQERLLANVSEKNDFVRAQCTECILGKIVVRYDKLL